MRKLFFVIFFLNVNKVFSQTVEPIQTDRPDQTESAAITPLHQAQFEFGFVFEDNKPVHRNLVYPNLLAKYGLTKSLELRLIAEYSKFEEYTNQGAVFTKSFAPVMIGAKTNLCDEKNWRPKTSLILHLGLPFLGSRIYKDDAIFSTFRFLMQHTLNEKTTLAYNLGAEWDGVSPKATGIYTVTIGYSINSHVGSYIELFGFAPQKQREAHNFDMGFTYLINSDIQLDISGGAGLTSNAPKYFIGCGFSFRTGH